jgi:hypothetical protein
MGDPRRGVMVEEPVRPPDAHQGERESRLRERPDYENAMETVRRFTETVGESDKPIRILRESTRGTWARTCIS